MALPAGVLAATLLIGCSKPADPAPVESVSDTGVPAAAGQQYGPEQVDLQTLMLNLQLEARNSLMDQIQKLLAQITSRYATVDQLRAAIVVLRGLAQPATVPTATRATLSASGVEVPGDPLNDQQVQELIAAIEARLVQLQTQSQRDMVRLQSLIDRYQMSSDISADTLRSLSDAIDTITQGMR